MDGQTEHTINAEPLHSSNALFMLGIFSACDLPSVVVNTLTWIPLGTIAFTKNFSG